MYPKKFRLPRSIIIASVIILLIVVAVFLRERNQVDSVTRPLETASYMPGQYSESIETADGRTRTYELYIPTGFRADNEYPLILLFHGGNGEGGKVLNQTEFSTAADERGFIVVAPDGIDNNWADGRGTTEPDIQRIDDVAFMRQLAAHLKTKLPINADRIYATGPSNGGMFTFRLACDASDLITAAAPVIASLPSNLTSTCAPQPIPLMVIQGTKDPFIPIEGGDTSHERSGAGHGGLVESAQKIQTLFAQNNQCNEVPETALLPARINDGTEVTQITYNDCANNATVVYYIVEGMGHTWPPKGGVLRSFISGSTSRNINATEVISEFFENI